MKTKVKVWTITDVKKRKKAKDNNLNYIELFGNKITKEELLCKIKRVLNNYSELLYLKFL